MRPILFTLALSACGPSIISSTPRSVTIDRVNESTIGKATDMAQSECAKYNRDAELVSTDDVARDIAGKAVTFKCVDRASEAHADVPKPTKAATPDGRPVVVGTLPLFCVSGSDEVGQCWTIRETCESSGAGVTCEQRSAGSCFTATRQLDGRKSSTCAVSIKDCETRRAAVVADADFTVTKCGIYRVGGE